MKNDTAVIVLNSPFEAKSLKEGYLICVDGGYSYIKQYNRTPDLLLGDFDSFDKSQITDKNIEIITYNAKKNFSDGEAAIHEANSRGYKKIYIYGISNGRLDHVLTNLRLFKIADDLSIEMIGIDGDMSIHFLSPKKEFECNAEINDIISLIPFEKCRISYGDGLMYKLPKILDNKKASRGLSNVAVKEKVRVKLEKGSAYLFWIKKMQP